MTTDTQDTAVGYDPARTRAAFPALDDTTARLDGAAGTQVPRSVIDAIADVYRGGMANVNGVFAGSHRCEAIVVEARQAVADLLGGHPDGIVLGANMTTLTYRFAATLALDWRPGDEVIVSRLDHDANVRPWVAAAEHAGAVVRWAEIDVPSGDLPVEQFDTLLTDRTRLVALAAAGNVTGTIPDLPAIARRVHDRGALLYVDGVHAAAHLPVDIEALGADFYAVSAYKWYGPHVGAVAGNPEVLATLRPDKLAPATNRVPDRFETGTPPFADLAGVTAAVDHIAALDPAATGTRRQRLLSSMAAVQAYEQVEFRHLMTGLAELPHVRLVGAPAQQTPTAFFTVDGIAPREVARRLAERGINVWSGHAFAWEVTGALGVRDSGGAIRAGLNHYTLRWELDRLLDAVTELGHRR
jgi:cysteine desulfurase family protein (TIGR01976 family)